MKEHVKRRRVLQDKRASILESAIAVFANKGYAKATILEVAKKAKVACGTVYLYFKSKDDLLIQCMHELMDSKLGEIKAEVAKESNAMDGLYKFFIKHIELFTSNPVAARFMVLEIRQSEEFYLRYPTYNPLNDYVDFVRILAQRAIDEGSIRNVDANALAIMIIGAMDLTLTQWLIGAEQLDMTNVTDNIRTILRYGLSPANNAENVVHKLG